jgi:hypothetical protein
LNAVIHVGALTVAYSNPEVKSIDINDFIVYPDKNSNCPWCRILQVTPVIARIEGCDLSSVHGSTADAFGVHPIAIQPLEACEMSLIFSWVLGDREIFIPHVTALWVEFQTCHAIAVTVCRPKDYDINPGVPLEVQKLLIPYMDHEFPPTALWKLEKMFWRFKAASDIHTGTNIFDKHYLHPDDLERFTLTDQYIRRMAYDAVIVLRGRHHPLAELLISFVLFHSPRDRLERYASIYDTVVNLMVNLDMETNYAYTRMVKRRDLPFYYRPRGLSWMHVIGVPSDSSPVIKHNFSPLTLSNAEMRAIVALFHKCASLIPNTGGLPLASRIGSVGAYLIKSPNSDFVATLDREV